MYLIFLFGNSVRNKFIISIFILFWKTSSQYVWNSIEIHLKISSYFKFTFKFINYSSFMIGEFGYWKDFYTNSKRLLWDVLKETITAIDRSGSCRFEIVEKSRFIQTEPTGTLHNSPLTEQFSGSGTICVLL